MRRYTVNRGDLDRAVKLRETFVDAPARKAEPVDWKWPRAMREVGVCLAVQYTSDKWRAPGDFIDYKHKAEAPQRLLVADGFLREYDTSRPIAIAGPEVELDGPMPTSFAVLAPVLGIQCQLYEGDEEEWALPNHASDNLYQVDIARAWLGAAEHPATGQTFLVVYTKQGGPCCIVTGDELAIEKDGIVGN